MESSVEKREPDNTVEIKKKKKEQSAFRKSIGSTFKTLYDMFLRLLIVAIFAFLVGWGMHHYRQKKVLPLAEARNYRQITRPQFEDTKLNLTTKWKNNKLIYIFRIDGYPLNIKEFHSTSSRKKGINWKGIGIQFSDGDGFELATDFFFIDEMHPINDNDGNCTGLTLQGEIDMSADDYRDISDWNIGWNFAESIPIREQEAGKQ